MLWCHAIKVGNCWHVWELEVDKLTEKQIKGEDEEQKAR